MSEDYHPARAVSSYAPPVVAHGSKRMHACDLYDVEATARTLDGVTSFRVAAGALIPPVRLLQATRADAQLLAADTLARAATKVGVRDVTLSGDDETEAIARAFAQRGVVVHPPARDEAPALRVSFARSPRAVVSIQRMTVPAEWTAARAAHEYLAFVPRLFAGLIAAQHRSTTTELALAGVHVRLLSLFEDTRITAHDAERCVLRVVGGAFARGRGCLELRIVDAPARRILLTAVHGFEPALPFPLYLRTQARVHAWVMRAFSRHLVFAAHAGTTDAARRFVRS